MKYTPRTAAGKLAIAALLSVSIMAPTVAAPSGTVWATTANTVQKNMEMDKANSEGITEHLSDMAAEVSNIRTGGTVTVAGDQQITVTRNRETGWQADQIQLLLGAGPDVSLDKDGWIQKLQNQLNESLSGFTTDEKQDSWVVKGYSKALSAIAYSEGFTDSYFDTLDNEKLADILEALYHIAIGDADYKFNQAQSDFVKNAGFPSDDVRELLIAVFKSDEDTEGLAQEFEKYEDDKALLAADDDNADNDAIYRAILIKKKEAEANWTAAQAATSVVDKQTYADAAHAAAVAAEKYLKKLKDPDEDLTKKAETAVGEAFAAATFAYKDTADTYPDTERVKKLTALNTAKGDMKTAEGYGYVFDSDFKESLLKGLAENANTSASHAELAQFYQQEAEKYLDEARKATTAGDVEKTKAAAAAAAEAAKKAAEAAENAGADGVRTRSEADIEKAQTAANAAQAAATTAEKQIDIAQQVADAATADDNAQTASDEATDAAGHVTAAEKWKDAAKAHGNAVTAALENGDYGTAESEAKKATTAAKNAQAEFDKVMADSDATEQQKTAAKKAAEDAWDAAIGAWQAIVNDPNAPAELKNTAQDELNKAKAEKDKVTNTEVSTGTPEKPEKPSTGGTGDGEQDSEKEDSEKEDSEKEDSEKEDTEDKDTGKQGAEDEDTQDDDTGKQGTEDPDEVKTQLDKVTTLVEEAEAELEKGNIENAISKLDEAENAAEELKRLAEESGNPADLLAAAEAFSKLAIARAKVTEALVKEGKLDDADAQFKKAEEAAKTSRELATKVDTAVKATADTADDELGTKADGHAKAAEAAVAKAKKALDDAKAAKAEADAKAKEAEKQAADLAEAKQKATAVIEKLPYLSDDERKDFLEQVKNADSSSSVVTILANAMKASVTNNPNLSKEDKEKYTNAFDSGMTIDELINQNPYTDSGELKDAANQDPSTGETTSGSSKIPWWAYLLGFLGIGGGVLGWGYVHDADFRAVVDEAIANVERALGLRH